MKLTAVVDFDANDFARGADYDEALEFIKAIDLAIGEWGFTLDLIAYFLKQREEYLKECAADGTEPDPRMVLK